jgi:hypothetical protein
MLVNNVYRYIPSLDSNIHLFDVVFYSILLSFAIIIGHASDTNTRYEYQIVFFYNRYSYFCIIFRVLTLDFKMKWWIFCNFSTNTKRDIMSNILSNLNFVCL